jgi:hypothetical protein
VLSHACHRVTGRGAGYDRRATLNVDRPPDHLPDAGRPSAAEWEGGPGGVSPTFPNATPLPALGLAVLNRNISPFSGTKMQSLFQENQMLTAAVGTKCHRAGTDRSEAANIGFIRVRKRKLKGAHRARYGRPITSSASFDVVRAVRVDGRPTHLFVLGLGSQKSIDPHGPCRFWIWAIHRMIRHGLTESQRYRLMAEMVRKGARLPGFADCDQRRLGSWQCGYTQEIEELKRFIGRADPETCRSGNFWADWPDGERLNP